MKQCLVIDDASVIRKVARHIVESLRFEVIEAENAQIAIEHCKRRLPEVILLDWQLPGLSATEFLATLRGIPGGKRPQIVYCTTEHDAVDIGRAAAAGADSYMMKPFDRASIEQKFAELAAAV